MISNHIVLYHGNITLQHINIYSLSYQQLYHIKSYIKSFQIIYHMVSYYITSNQKVGQSAPEAMRVVIL